MEIARHIDENTAKKFNPRQIIRDEVRKLIVPCLLLDPISANYNKEIARDHKKSEYLFMQYLNISYSPQKIVYAGCGFDTIPKTVFSEEKVFHTSLEKFNKEDREYFNEIGNGHKIIANNIFSPFADSSFDLALLLGLEDQHIKNQKSEIVRVLKNNGLIVCDNLLSFNNHHDEVFSEFQKLEIPPSYQFKGISEISYSIYKNKKS